MNNYAVPYHDRVTMLVHIAEMYYKRQMSQQDIADKLCFSRSAISRFLTKAREMNIVNIRVHHPVNGLRSSRHAERTDMLCRVAEMYYKEQMSQQDIADTLGFSRSAISRFLNEANKQNIVCIDVAHVAERIPAEL